MAFVVKDGVITELRAEPLATAVSRKRLFQGAPLGRSCERQMDFCLSVWLSR